MITIQCDNCDRPFEARPEDAGGKLACPYCGDVNRVPAAERPTQAKRDSSRPASAEQEPRGGGEDGQSAAPGEMQLRVVRPAMFRAHPFRYAFIVLLFVIGAAGVIAPLVTDRIAPWAIWPSLVLIAGTGVWFGWWWLSTHYWVRLIVSNKRTIRQEGIVKRHTTEVLHDHVRSVDIRQTFLERIMGVGTIGIDSAGQDEIEIEAHDIPGPYEVKRLIDKHRKM